MTDTTAEASVQWQPIETLPESLRPPDSVLVFCPFTQRVGIDAVGCIRPLLACAKRDEEPCYYSHWAPLPEGPK